MSAPATLLSVRNLSLEFRTRSGTVRALEEVSLDVARGETVGIVGESGSGKSVLSFAILRILDAAARVTSGTIRFAGMDVMAASEAELDTVRGREIAMIFQNPRTALNPIRRVGKQIEDVLRAHTTTLSDALRSRAVECLAQVRIPDPERRYAAYPFELSGGQCQRVMIALALACAPQLLIADEPTTGLDVTTQAAIMRLIRELAREQQMATILITHDLALASEHCDRIIVMHAGQIVESAPAADLFVRPVHPYTAQLIRSTPTPDGDIDGLASIPGNLPDLRRSDLPRCRFLERCTRAVPRCVAEPPNLLEPQADHRPGASIRNEDPAVNVLDCVELKKSFPVAGRPTLRALLRGERRRESRLHAVDDVNFSIAEGESVGLVGESGCGKSTLVRLITRMLDYTSGDIIYRGRNIGFIPARKFAETAFRTKIQMVFQDPTDSLNPRFSASDAIEEPLRRLAGVTALAWLAPLGLLLATLGPQHVLSQIAWLYSELALITFGGAYAVLSHVAERAVLEHGWLLAGQMADGLGLAESTPGPLILVLQFVAFVAAYQSETGGSPVIVGIAASALAIWFLFVPSFLWIFLGGPHIERLNANIGLRTALAFVTAAVVGVIAHLSLWFTAHVLFASVQRVETDLIQILYPMWSSIQWRAVGLTALAAVLLFGLHQNILRTLAVAGSGALLLHLIWPL
ncbi:MAG: ATP-binding cassette domain-containing protein [Gammaproteobacteria bacterium]|nr:ATP-binding cassette domain-containing protein [Gammaproteobacteria bacterium]